MIRLGDAFILAGTKLRSHRIRTFVAVLIPGLLFAGLTASLIVAQGTETSIASFSQEGLNSRYIVRAASDPPLTYTVVQDQSVQRRAQAIYDQTIADKKAAASKLGVSYDPSMETKPVMTLTGFPGSPSRDLLNLTSAAAQQAIKEYIQVHPGPGLGQLRQVAQTYHPVGFYGVTTGGVNAGSLALMKNGQENFDQSSQLNGPQQSDILQTHLMERADKSLTKPFMVSGTATGSAIPLIVPYSVAEQLLGLPSLSKSAPAEQQLARIRTLYAKAPNLQFTACYRNSVSQEQISTAISQADEASKNASNSKYQKPSLMYGLPAADACGPAVVLSDTRTQEEKSFAAKQDQFAAMFGSPVLPVQQKLTFQIVGLAPDPPNGSSSTSFNGLLQSVVGSSLDGALVIPGDMFDKLPNASAMKAILFPSTGSPLGFPVQSYYVEFANADDARAFIAGRSCTTRSDGTCALPGRPFQLTAYGSNSIALEDLQNKFMRIFVIAVLVVVALASVIMAGVIGRMIADARRETAVFRAIGAKRADVVEIYSLYALSLSAWIAVFALIAGGALAYGFDMHLWQSATVQAQLLFGASNTVRQFHLFALSPLLADLLPIIFATGILGMCLPLAFNVRRSLVKDLREE